MCRLKRWTDPRIDTVVERAAVQEPTCELKYLDAPRVLKEHGLTFDQAVELGKRKEQQDSDFDDEDGGFLF